MPNRWESAPLVEQVPKWASAPLVEEAPTHPTQPTASSRFLENTVKPVEAVSDAIQSALRSRNPPMALLESAGRGAKNVVNAVANTENAKVGNPIGGVVEMALDPVITAGKDALRGNFGAAAGGLAGLALPFLPKAAKAAIDVSRPARAAIAGGVKGGATAGLDAVIEAAKAPPTAIDLIIPGAARTKLAIKAVPAAYRGAKEGARAATDALRPQPTPITPPPVAPQPSEPLSRLNPEQLANAQKLAEEFNTPAGPAQAPPQFEAGARAQKVWNVTDTIEKLPDVTPEAIAEWTPQHWKQVTDATNAINLQEWTASGGKGKRPKIHAVPSLKTRQEIVEELRAVQARRQP